VDCIVEGVPTVSLDPYIARKEGELAAAGKVTDIRFAGAESPLGFKKWVGALKAAVQDELPPAGVYSLNFVAECELKQTAIAALKPHCKVFVRGVR